MLFFPDFFNEFIWKTVFLLQAIWMLFDVVKIVPGFSLCVLSKGYPSIILILSFL